MGLFGQALSHSIELHANLTQLASEQFNFRSRLGSQLTVRHLGLSPLKVGNLLIDFGKRGPQRDSAILSGTQRGLGGIKFGIVARNRTFL
ncbi:hypothetical protein NK6_9281 [Bradyrhizobium diazoefficiens]|uniref:Uncharacterized protein n=1 Tax=Bradyrhizobium diazoefficiens TaxID=1355477 RepID=A0A0E3VXC5_9BRAD|nr:hypothetical protein NK6_9281 [Bradyrhizobium diazoefficiens]